MKISNFGSRRRLRLSFPSAYDRFPRQSASTESLRFLFSLSSINEGGPARIDLKQSRSTIVQKLTRTGARAYTPDFCLCRLAERKLSKLKRIGCDRSSVEIGQGRRVGGVR